LETQRKKMSSIHVEHFIKRGLMTESWPLNR